MDVARGKPAGETVTFLVKGALGFLSLLWVVGCDVACLRNSDCGGAGICSRGLCQGIGQLDGGAPPPVVVNPGREGQGGMSAMVSGGGGVENMVGNTDTPIPNDAGTQPTQSSGILDASR